MSPMRLGLSLMVAIVVAAPTLAPAWHSGEVVIGGYRLPREHRFESPDASGKYNVVKIDDVPTLIQQGKFVFDRTANVWIKNPNGTTNPQYLASAAKETPKETRSRDGDRDRDRDIHGEYRLPRDHRYESPNAAGKYEVVERRDVPALIKQGRFVFDRTAKEWVKNPNGTMNPKYLASAPASAAKGAVPAGQYRVHGQVAAIGGSTMDLKADDGRDLVVQMGSAPPDLQPGDTVTVTGKLSGNTLEAASIQKDKK